MDQINEMLQSNAGWNLDNTYLQLPKFFYTHIQPTPVKWPKMILFNHKLAENLGLDPAVLDSPEGAALFSGNQLFQGLIPLAQAYAGHQFGHFTTLGDGRAILIGEQVAPDGRRFDLQLKGAGQTPYSRQGDGRAALGPMLREYIISEAMHALGIPTTRSLAVVATGEPVYRETRLPGAILTRVAASHLRVGTFEFAASLHRPKDLKKLADYTLLRHFPEAKETGEPGLALLQGVILRQSSLIAQWILVGFIHGVMNTDNMALSGETIDYGPCAFMNEYNPHTVFSSIDHQGRYAYGNQPTIGGWNLARFAESLLPLLHPEKPKAIRLAQDALDTYPSAYHRFWIQGMRAKLGLFDSEKEDGKLIGELLELMLKYRSDYTNFFLSLTYGNPAEPALEKAPSFQAWRRKWVSRLSQESRKEEERLALMKKSNPALIPRNHQVEAALDAAVSQKDLALFHRLMQALQKPYAHESAQKAFASPPPPSEKLYRTFCGT